MSSQHLLSLSLPPSNLRSDPTGNLFSSVLTTQRQPKRVSICGLHEISPPTSQTVSSIQPYEYCLQSGSILPSVANPLIGRNPHLSKTSIISFENCGGYIEQNESNQETARCGLTPHCSDNASIAHAFPNFHSMLGASLVQNMQQPQREKMALARSSATNDAVLALLCLGYSPSFQSKTTVNAPDQVHGATHPSRRTKVQFGTIKESVGAVKRPFPKNIELASVKTLRASLRPKTLSMSSDIGNVNGLHRFVRSELLELFEPSPATESNQLSRSRVGLRCVNCAQANRKKQKVPSTYSFFPKSVEDIYIGVCTWQRRHFAHCNNVPKTKTQKYLRLKEDKRRGKKAYWAHSAYELGLRNVSHKREGIMWCQETK